MIFYIIVWMNVIRNLETRPNLSLALGFFDGLHQGHKVVIKNAVNFAKENNSESGIILFSQHPMCLITKGCIKHILTLDEKIDMLKDLEVDNVFVLDFNEKLAQLTATEYLRDILVKHFSPIAITTGFNHTFGHNRQGNSNFLRKFQSVYNYRYFEIPPITCNQVVTSSSSIRNAVTCGNLYLANALLSYNFFVKTEVTEGDKIGRTIGFPTANFSYPESIVEIPTGIYLVEVEVNKETYKGVLNYGYRPTIDDKNKLIAEVHILNFNEDIYGQPIKVSFITKIRNEIKFDSIEQLKAQIIKDIDFAQTYQFQ